MFLCEKPSQGKDIAQVLSATERTNGSRRGQRLAVTEGSSGSSQIG